jgi:signal transduction histidine kinase
VSAVLPPAARLLILAVVVSGGTAAAAWATGVPSWDTGDLLACIGIVVATAIAERFPVEVHYRNERDVYSLSDAIWTGALLLAQPSVLALAVGAGVLAGQLLQRRPPLKVAFNAGQFLLAITVALGVFAVLGSPPADEPAGWLAAAAAMAAFQVVNTLLVGAILALAERRGLAGVLQPSTGVLQWAGSVSAGVLAAIVWADEPTGLPLLVVPLGLTYLAYRGWLRTVQERDWMAQMGEAADAIARSADLTKRITGTERPDPVGGLAATLNNMLDALEASFNRERTFVRESSHELRTPITICRGHLEVLPPDPAPDELPETIAMVLGELDRMTRIIDDMAELAYMEDPASLRTGSVELAKFLPDVASKAGPLLNGRLRVAPVAGEGTIQADVQRLTQALINLIKNARDHTPADTPIELRVVSDDAACRFEVADAGGGLSPEDAQHAFQPFYKGSDSDGSGLGLAIVSGIARAHGGVAGVDNRVGQGATFWIRLPR